jgi:hypothetical protein
MVVIRGIFGFIIFIVVYLVVLAVTNVAFGFLSFFHFGFDRYISLLWSGVVGSTLSVIAGNVILDKSLKRYPERAIAGAFMALNVLLIADYLFLIPRQYWT